MTRPIRLDPFIFFLIFLCPNYFFRIFFIFGFYIFLTLKLHGINYHYQGNITKNITINNFGCDKRKNNTKKKGIDLVNCTEFRIQNGNFVCGFDSNLMGVITVFSCTLLYSILFNLQIH